MRIPVALACLILAVSCGPTEKQSAENAALQEFKTYVDSILEVNRNTKFGGDTEFVEVPVDVNDPTITQVDTFVTMPVNGDSCFFHYGFGQALLKQSYAAKLKEVQGKLAGAEASVMKDFSTYQVAIDTLLKSK